jgi:hypothetical protein
MPRGVPRSAPKVKSKTVDVPAKIKTPQRGVGQGVGGGREKKYTPEWIDEEADALLDFINRDGGMYIGSFARERGYHRQRFPDFIKVSEKFRDAYREAQQWQEEKFIRNALTRTWDPGFTARCMARVCGDEWKNSFDKEESDKEVILNITVN